MRTIARSKHITLFLIITLLLSRASAWSSFCHTDFTLHKAPSTKYSRVRLSNDIHDADILYEIDDDSRRSFIKSSIVSFAGILSSCPGAALIHQVRLDPSSAKSGMNYIANNANAMGLVTFPCPESTLANTYHIMRAGQSLLEEKNILSTNPLFLTNRDDALTTLGVIQIENACADMIAKGINPSVVKYSLASKCIDTANIVATRMMIGRNRIVPEFTFMDPRGAGSWDGGCTEAAIWALDNAEAGVEGRDGRPPPNDDGTANETLFEQMIRLRQLMSILETQYSGDSILLIFPDGTSAALLSCLIAGIPMKDVHALNFEPGEVRLDVTMDNTLNIYKERIVSPKYKEMLKTGQQQLEALREQALARQAEENAPPQLIVASKPPSSKKVAHRPLEFSFDGDDVYPIGAMSAIAYMTMLRKGKDDDPSAELETKPEQAPQLVLANTGYVNGTESSIFNNFQRFPESAIYYKGENAIEKVPILSREERRKAAEEAMEEYINDESFYDDWLNSMKEIKDE